MIKWAEAKVFMDQVHVFTESGYSWDSERLAQEGTSTFFSFPYDIVRFLSAEEKLHLKELETANDPIALRRFYLDKCRTLSLWGGCIDGVYSQGKVSIKNVQAYTFFGGKLVDLGQTNQAELQSQILSAIHSDEICSESELPSDHMALVFTGQ